MVRVIRAYPLVKINKIKKTRKISPLVHPATNRRNGTVCVVGRELYTLFFVTRGETSSHANTYTKESAAAILASILLLSR